MTGAGRPHKTSSYARTDFNRAINELIATDIPRLIETLKALAYGISAVRVTERGEEVVYTTLPDRACLIYLIDRLAGKPAQAVALDPATLDIRAAVESTRQAADAYRDPDEAPDAGDDGDGG